VRRLGWFLVPICAAACVAIMAADAPSVKIIDARTCPLTKPSLVMDSNRVPFVEVGKGTHHMMESRRIFDFMGVTGAPLGCDIHHYRPGGFQDISAHEDAYHLFLVLKGDAVVQLQDTYYKVHPGTVVYVPPGTQHRWVKVSSKGLSVLFVSGQAKPPAGQQPAGPAR